MRGTSSTGAPDGATRTWRRAATRPRILVGLLAAAVFAASANAAVTPRVATFRSGLESPWGLAFLPDGSLLVTEKPGRLRHVSASGAVLSGPIIGVPAVDTRSQGGLFDVLVDRDFASSRRIFLSYAEPGTGSEAGLTGTTVVSARLARDLRSLTDLRVVFRQRPKLNSVGHYGARLAQAPNGLVYVTTGDRQGWRDEAQNTANTVGKVVRIRRDGTVPSTNPFVGTPGAAPEIWSIGHRNPQGAVIHPSTGELWTHEHGPQGGDEVNVTRRGRNYGWPRISHGCEYGSPTPCTPVGGRSQAPGMEQPATWWGPYSTAPSGMAFYTGARFPEWKGNLFVGALAGRGLWRLTVDGRRVTSRELLLTPLGERIRDVRQGPDGWLYLLTDNPAGRILRVER